MSRAQVSASVVLALVAVLPARADMSNPLWVGTDAKTCWTSGLRACEGGWPLAGMGVPAPVAALSRPAQIELPSASSTQSAEQPGRLVPDSPSSLALFLSAMGSLGLWQVGRSARKFHLSHAPEWFHTGGPAQVGHSVPIAPGPSPALAAFSFHQPDDRPPSLPFAHPAPHAPFNSQDTPPIASPRGPPSFAL